MKHADIISVEGDAICTLTELNCLTPRGRYDVKFFTDFIDLHGKTFDYKIPYDHILRLFLLPHKDNRQMYFVVKNLIIKAHRELKLKVFKVAVDPPIKQGQTRYPYIIFLFNNDENISIELTISE
jgi:structure-specific recognition protein 1